jgi:ankyrin repeat protein
VLSFLLERRANINDKNDKNETALLLVARAGANSALKFLLGIGA